MLKKEPITEKNIIPKIKKAKSNVSLTQEEKDKIKNFVKFDKTKLQLTYNAFKEELSEF